MLYNSNEVQIESYEEKGAYYLLFKFKGRFTKAASQSACKVWTSEFSKYDRSYNLIWDCTEMNGFETSAKDDWTETLKLLQDRIDCVTVVSDNIFIRGACRLMSKLVSFEMEIIKSTEQSGVGMMLVA